MKPRYRGNAPARFKRMQAIFDQNIRTALQIRARDKSRTDDGSVKLVAIKYLHPVSLKKLTPAQNLNGKTRKFLANFGFTPRIAWPLFLIELLRMKFHHEIVDQCNCSVINQFL